MINIAFWNAGISKIKTRDQSYIDKIHDTISRLIIIEQIDIFALCEYPIDGHDLICREELCNYNFKEANYIIERKDTRVFYSNTKIQCCSTTSIDQDRYVYNRFITDNLAFNFVCIHLSSKLYSDGETQLTEAHTIIDDIKEKEQQTDRKTIIIGDFNAEPYETPLLHVLGFHALSDQEFSERGRIVKNIKYEAFYNPSWNLYGDFRKPTGTYFYNNSGALNQLWYLFDQVIMRSEMTKFYVPGSLRILNVGLENKLGRPGISDHFPIIFTINEEEKQHD